MGYFPYPSVYDHNHLGEPTILLPNRPIRKEVQNVCNYDWPVPVCFRCLFLLFPVDDISSRKDRGVGFHLKSLFYFDKLGRGEHFGSERFLNEIGVWLRSRGNNLPRRRWNRSMGGTGCTYDKTSSDLSPRLED